ncbi:MAG TPA: serine/threonine protein kinase, partial [Streptomyces sp.]
VALIVAVAAGASVYTLMNGDGTADAKHPDPSPTADRNGTAPDTASPAPSPSPSGTPTGEGAVPASYLGTWKATIDNANGVSTRELTIAQGEPGAAGLTLIAEGPGYHCEFTATLTRRATTDDGPLTYGPSRVTTGRPLTSCTPGGATEVTLLPNGGLQRVNAATGEKLVYSKA